MKTLPLISRNDYSILNIKRIMSGYNSAVHQISIGEINYLPSFFIYDKDNSVYGISAPYFQHPIPQKDADKIAPYLIELEDKRFYRHSGVDWHSVLRAALANMRNIKIVQGGSTITMQLIRNTLIEKSPSVIRKIIEMKLAKTLERNFSKKEILRLYCENVFMGKGLRGLQSASYFIYRKPLSHLNEIEIFGLLGMLRSPESFSPLSSVAKYSSRQKFISKKLAGKDVNILHSINPIKINIPVYERHSRVMHRDLKTISKKEFLKIKRLGTTIDIRAQKNLDKILCEESTINPKASLSTVVMDNSNGYILAESSWKNGRQMIFSTVFEGYIQPGSTFKTFALIAALEQGYGLDTKLVSSPFSSIVIKNNDGNFWSVKNYQNIYRGEISLLDAFVYSDNCAFARLVELLDHKQLFSVYKRFGLINESDVVYPSIVLGALSKGVSCINIALAYQALANNGYMVHNAQFARYCEFQDGRFYFHPSDVMSGKIVIATDILHEVNRALNAAAFSYGFNNLYAKTGTSNIGKIIVAFGANKTIVSWLEGIEDYAGHFLSNGTSKNTPLFPRIINKLID